MIEIENQQSQVEWTEELETAVRRVVEEAFRYEGIAPRAVSMLLTDNEGIRRLNGTYRGKDRATDVLSFPLYEEDGTLDPEELGDIVISLERAQEQALEYGHGLVREVAFLTAHSMLHLFGYDHENGEQEMYGKQEDILQNLGITR